MVRVWVTLATSRYSFGSPSLSLSLTSAHAYTFLLSYREKPYLLYFNIFSWSLNTHITSLRSPRMAWRAPVQVRVWGLHLSPDLPGSGYQPLSMLSAPRCVYPPAQRPHGPWNRNSFSGRSNRSSTQQIGNSVCQGAWEHGERCPQHHCCPQGASIMREDGRRRGR